MFMCWTLQHVVIPAGLLCSIALRPYGLSIVYLLLYLIGPLVSRPRSCCGLGNKYFILTVLLSAILLTVHVAWHAVLASFSPYGSILSVNPMLPDIARNLGLIRYDNIDVPTGIKYLAPELVMTSVSLFVYLSVRNFLPRMDQSKNDESKYQQYPILIETGKFLSLFLILASGIMRPSVTSGVYFLTFLGSCTVWALGNPLERGFAVVQRILMCLMAIHITVLMMYQDTYLINLYPPDKNFARYFGLTQLVTIKSTDFDYKHTWTTLASPLVILVTYYFLGLESAELLKPKVAFIHISSKAPQDGESESSPLMRNVRKTKRMSMRSSFGKAQQNSVGSIIMSDEESMMDIGKRTVGDEISAAFLDLFKVLIRSSYIATIITMMTWSIMYHSWLSFVFLMWGNMIWLSHDQRSFMLKTSPIPVIYAICLLLADYVYGMDLTEEELPSKIELVNLAQIGVGRSDVEPCIPLSIKSLFTFMFWITLRQRCQEVRDKRYSAKMADLSSPLQLTLSTTASAAGDVEPEEGSRVLAAFGKWLRAMCARYWIYVVVIMLFVIGITGDRMTIFRIVYMFLFLSFILMFQLNWYWWRRLMYSFWITVIIYSMINLVLIYIYQFDNFSKTIADFLFINERLQTDLGLEPYQRADLFVKLLIPTLFLIMTIMQVHYFHKDFMRLSDPKIRSTSVIDVKVGSSRPSHGASTIQNDITPLDEDRPPSSTSDKSTQKDMTSSLNMDREDHKSRKLSRARSQHAMTDRSLKFTDVALRALRLLRELAARWLDYIFLFLELHFMKTLLISCMLLCVLNVCAMHVPLMFIISPACLLSRSKQRKLIHLISILITVYFMAMMVYQIPYIQHSVFDVSCYSDAQNGNVTLNTADWIGFAKSSRAFPLARLLKGYIAMITMFVIYSLVTYRQEAFRSRHDMPNGDNVLFPEVKRADADKDLVNCIKFLFNFGFYKFGVEITLICLVGVIGSRMDFYSVLYAIWLIVLTSVRRAKKQQLWLTFTVFITLIIPLQYCMAVGFLPELCIVNLPWSGDTDQMKHIRNWMFLPCQLSPPHSSKLICDFILLVMASRQLRVFRTEKRHGWNYAGGSNKENIGKDWETPDFVNPVPDFLGQVGSWLDLLKRMIFLGMLWVTLAIMFLAGTNRVNLFSMGYLVGSFIVLWQGTDFYLRPKETILLWWSWLIRYNVSVVMVKALLQLPGCVFKSFMHEQACWLVQLLGIGCVDKFAGGSIKSFIRMSYYESSSCSLAQKDIGLAWDGVCFAFLILQRRLFDSYYFFRVIDESKASTVLASRGAELIEELRQKQMQAQETQEVNILEKIKIKMERIKANQKKIQGALKEPKSHERGDSPTYRPPASHQSAIRSGDYYMFEEFDDWDGGVIKTDEAEEEDQEIPKEMGLGKTHREHSSRPESHTQSRAASARRDSQESQIDDMTEEADKETTLDTLKGYCELAWALISSFLTTLTRALMKYSRDYRYVSRTLSVEKRKLKESEGFGIGTREGVQMIWQPLPETLVNQHGKILSTLEDQDDSFRHGRSPFVRLLKALWYAVVSHTDIVCYIMVFINQIQSATILSIPLPLMVFLWGTLTIPRPTKTFWVTLIAYTEVIVLIKSMFQFEILPWNQKVIPDNMPFTAPRIIGIERKNDYALYDLLLLLIIFLHRFMLKSLGLWKESASDIEVPDDMEYCLTPEDAQLVIKGQGDEVGRKYIQQTEETSPKVPVPDTSMTVVDEVRQVGMTDKASNTDDAGPSHTPNSNENEPDNDMDVPMIAVTTTIQNTQDHYPSVIKLSLKRYLSPVRHFFRRMMEPGARVTADVYAYMFMCDFANFLVVIFGFAAFGTHQGDGGVQAYLEENKVPLPFLVMLILQFALIVIDRALYLRKYILGKILFQYALVIGVHIWMFFVLPAITERKFNALLPPSIWYIVKSLYLLLSAYQIRCGYPRRIIGNFLCKSYRFINMVLFRSFMAVPFVFELRTLMDWIWTDTSMTLVEWLKMEDIFACIFLLKCGRCMESDFPSERGRAKSKTIKYLLGGSVLSFVIAIIWFPLVFFAFGNTVGEPNAPTDVTVKIRIGPFLPVYQMTAQSHNIESYTEAEYSQLSNLYARDRNAQTFLSNYMFNDVAVVTINPNSTMKWVISPPELDRLEREVVSNSTLMVTFSFIITHPSNSVDNPPTIEDSREVAMPALRADLRMRNPERDKLYNMLAGTETEPQWLDVKGIFPKFLKVFNKGTAKPAYQLMPPSTGEYDRAMYRDIQLRLERDRGALYWRVRETCAHQDPLLSIPLNKCDMLVMYTFNDKLFPATLNFISGGGIIGLYTTFVFLASRVLRGSFTGIYSQIMFDDLPNVDRVLQLCLDIYLVREALELTLEEDLFAKLVFLYRSPETMIKWSRPKDEDQPRSLPSPSH